MWMTRRYRRRLTFPGGLRRPRRCRRCCHNRHENELPSMKICYLDAFSGISGDMTVGALLDAGADEAILLRTLESLGTGATLRVEKTKRRGIAASKFHVQGGDAKTHRHLPHIVDIIGAADLPGRSRE